MWVVYLYLLITTLWSEVLNNLLMAIEAKEVVEPGFEPRQSSSKSILLTYLTIFPLDAI